MKRINIYLEPKERKELDRLKNKYHLSYSTITDIVTNWILSALPEGLSTHYFHDKKGYKTSIKPRNKVHYIEDKPSIIYTNCLNIFLRKELLNYLPKEKADKCINKIYAEFQNTYDDSWNGNQLCRFIPKFFKQNPTYTKKLLGIEEE